MGLGFYSRRLAKKINSTALMADAWHHYLDAISTFLVVTAFIFSYFEYPQLDGPVGLLITLTIFYSAYKIAKTPIDHLLGTPPNEELLDRIEKISLNFPEVKGVHDVIIHNYGEFMIMSLHIEIEESLSFIEAHQISEQVDKTLTQQLGAYVTVHYDPVMERTPLYQDIEQKIKRFCDISPHCDSFHDLRIYGHQNQIKVILDLVASASLKENDNKVLVEECERFIKKSIPEIDKITIKVEPKFSISRKSRHH
jgi:divalent metal cation (Fe/Co/Zn/Cd) transporter